MTAVLHPVPLRAAPRHVLPVEREVQPVGRAQLRSLVREAVLLVTLLLAYTGGRLLASQDLAAAYDHADEVLRLERLLHLPAEQHVQAVVLAHPLLGRAAAAFYASAHLPVTALALAWLFLRRPEHYRWARRALVSATGLALAVYVLVPTAPPRMLTSQGFVDLGHLLGLSVYSTSTQSPLTNQFAAMPSLHVGWAVLVATVCIAASRTRWRWLWLLHPLVTVLVVVATGNHFWLDGIVGAAFVGAALVLLRDPLPLPSLRARARTS